MWTATTFTVQAAEVIGNQRLAGTDIDYVLGMTRQPIFKAVPAQMEKDLRSTYFDLESVHVQVGFPNHIRVTVVERQPVLAWYQNGIPTWIDANGIAFTPRGDVAGLVMISSNGNPTDVPTTPELPFYEQKFISPEMVSALTMMVNYVPAGLPMIYDPQYGMGWQDSRNWTVFFGQNTDDIPMKIMVYQSIVDQLTREGIQPTLISVEYLDAPFYK
jgi:cell division protein FtsQ